MYLVLLACDLVYLILFVTFYYTRWHLLLASLLFLCFPVYIASASRYPSQSRNWGRLLIAATQSSRLNCRSRLKVRSHGNNVRDVIIAHVISADAQIYIRIPTDPETAK